MKCLYCLEDFTPKRRDQTCCCRQHSQAYNRVKRPRVDKTAPPCCREYAEASKTGHRTCPQHHDWAVLRREELTSEDIAKAQRRAQLWDPEGMSGLVVWNRRNSSEKKSSEGFPNTETVVLSLL